MVILRNVGATLLGLVVGSLLNGALISLNSFVLFPMPPGTSMEDPAAFQAYLDTLPAVAFLVVMVAHLGQASLGGWIAARLGASRPVLLAMIVGSLTLLGSVINMVSIQGPAWFYVELPLELLVAYTAGNLEAKRRAQAATTG